MSEIQVKVNGTTLSPEFTEYTISRSVEDLTGTFSLSCTVDADEALPFKQGQEIQILVEGTPVLTGYIEILTVDYSDNSHDINIQGRDRAADVFDSTVGSALEIKATITLDQIIQRVLKQINAKGVKVINKVPEITAHPFTTDELVSGEITETLFSFLEKYTRKRQVLMTTDGLGNIVLSRSGQQKATSALYHFKDDRRGANNVKSAAMTFDNSQRFHTYRIVSQGNPSSNAAGVTPTTSVANRLGTATDSDIRASRVLDITAESSTDIATLKKRAEWEAKIRKARAIVYSVTVQGHTMDTVSKPWEPNLLVQINDDFAMIDAYMLIKSVTYSLTNNGGSTTDIEFVHPDSYLPEPVVSDNKKGKNKIGKTRRRGRKKKQIYRGPIRIIEGDEI